jgi:hypothetical protein
MLGAAALPSLCGLIAQQRGLSLVAPAILGMAAVLFLLHEVLLFTAGRSGDGPAGGSQV